MPRTPAQGNFLNSEALTGSGLTVQMLADGVASTYRTLDAVDKTLLDMGNTRLSTMVELANLSSMVGNLLGSAIANASNGVFRKNGPHKYPDLLANRLDAADMEIKIALENNKPKGHLAKPGLYLTCRYVLADTSGNFVRGVATRGGVVWVWELRAGLLAREHFTESNTPGDSVRQDSCGQRIRDGAVEGGLL